MLVESVSILSVLLLLAVVFLRAGHSNYALGILPLAVVPLVHTLGYAALRLTDRWLPQIPFRRMVGFCDVAALAVSCLLIVVLSLRLSNKRAKRVYTIAMCVYNVILSFALVHNMLQVAASRVG